MKKALYENLPESPGVYLMKDQGGRILYIGKAANLRRRVMSYFTPHPSLKGEGPHDYKIEKLINQIGKVDYKKTDTAIEALILEAKLIKKHSPQFNVKEKDDKNFLSVAITREKFPRIMLVRGKGDLGPFTSATSIREALRILRRIFPYSIHPSVQLPSTFRLRSAQVRLGISRTSAPYSIGKSASWRRRPCLDYEIGLCPGTCIGAVSRKDYLKNINNIKLFFEGKKRKIINNLTREMNKASRNLEFEKAKKIRQQLFALQHIQDVALIKDNEYQVSGIEYHERYRVEGYDVSNISGTSAVGAMVVFRNGQPDKNKYRKFRIKTIVQSDDVGMLKEVLRRRLHNNWPLPDLILIDGGKGQVNAAKRVLDEAGLQIPVIGIAKGPKRKNNKFIGRIPASIKPEILIRVRNEAHRFAIAYHKKLRYNKMISKSIK